MNEKEDFLLEEGGISEEIEGCQRERFKSKKYFLSF